MFTVVRSRLTPKEFFVDTISAHGQKDWRVEREPQSPIRNIRPRIDDGVRRFNQPRIASPPGTYRQQMYCHDNIFAILMSARAPAGQK